MKTLVFIHKDKITNNKLKLQDFNFKNSDFNGILCPFCKKENNKLNPSNEDYENNLQYTDYVIHPMGWLENCCGGRIVLDERSLKYIGKFNSDIKNNYLLSDNFKDCFFYEIELLYIKKIINHQIQNEYNIDDEEDFNFDNFYKLNVNEKKIFKYGIQVDSYNLENPKVKYDNNFDTSHDGILIHLLCLDKYNNSIYQCFWGD